MLASQCVLRQAGYHFAFGCRQSLNFRNTRFTSSLSYLSQDDKWRQNSYKGVTCAVLALGAALAASHFGISKGTSCDSSFLEPPVFSTHDNRKDQEKRTNETSPLSLAHHWTAVDVAPENCDVIEAHGKKKLRVFSADHVAENDGKDGKPIWMSYGGFVYNVTDFIQNHPGGSEKIMMAAGSAIEPFWHIYRQHFASDLPTRLMEHMVIGRLADEDQEKIDEQMEILYESSADPYAMEPVRHKALKIHSDQPMNAECPEDMLTSNYLTPSSLFFIRHHHPVPYLSEDQLKEYELEIDLSVCGANKAKFSFEDLKKMPKVEVTATLQCSGNRRSGFNKFGLTSGITWSQGAVSTAKWGGVKLLDLLKRAGLDDSLEANDKSGIQHVRFYGIDGMMASIGIEKAINPYGDVIICYEMNGEPLPRDHGFPLRVIVPGYAAVRSVKWINKIELSKEEAEGPWQRGLNYKVLPPNISDANGVDLTKIPSLMELSVHSGITLLELADECKSVFKPGETIMVKASGWAFSGGGRNIIRVDLSGNNARSWTSATLREGSNQDFQKGWAWTLWDAEVPAIVQDDGSVHVYSKAVDVSFNVQPESCKHIWNIRGLGNNSWFEKTLHSPQ